MIRSMIAIAAGYLFMAVLSGFTRLIISIYLRMDIAITGIDRFPPSWAIGITVLGFFFGLLGGLLTTTLSKSGGHIEILGLILFMVAIALIDYSMLSTREPLWYLITSPGLKILGIYGGYHLKTKQNLQLDQK